MEDLLGIVIIRSLVRLIGKYSRFLYFKLIGKQKSLKSLQDVFKGKRKDKIGEVLEQDFYNTIVGSFVFILISICLVYIIWS